MTIPTGSLPNRPRADNFLRNSSEGGIQRDDPRFAAIMRKCGEASCGKDNWQPASEGVYRNANQTYKSLRAKVKEQE